MLCASRCARFVGCWSPDWSTSARLVQPKTCSPVERFSGVEGPPDRIGGLGIVFAPYPATPKEREEYLEERMRLAHEPHEDGLMVLGGVEVMLLWESVVPSYIHRNWIAVILGAQAMCERGLAAIYEMQDLPGTVDHGRRNADRAVLGTLLRWAREDAITSDTTLDLVQTLCDRRKVLTHWKRPLDPGTIMRRIIGREGLDHLDSLEMQEYILWRTRALLSTHCSCSASAIR